MEGAYVGNGQIYLVADNLRSEQRALQVLAHEAVGHAAVEELFGDDLKFILEGVKYLEKTDKRVREIAQHVDETQPGLDEKTRSKEIIAVMAERGVHNNLMRRVMAAIRRFLRSIGIDMEFSYDDLAGMLRSAERYLESGGERTDIGDLQPLFSLKKNDIRNALASRGVKGDALENAVDLANDLKEKGGVITPEGTAILYHRTNKESAEKIVREQAMHGKEDGLFFGTSPTGQIEGYGEAVVQIEVPLEKISLNDVFANEAHVRMKTGTIGGKIPVRAKTAVQGQPLFQESKDIKRGSISVSPSGKEGELFQSDVKKQTGTPEFKKWFGDSKVVDEDGNPLLMYHGTAREFTEFDPSLSGSTYGTEQSGIFFTDDRENALAVARDAAESLKGAPRIMEVYLKINTPLTIKVSEEYATNYWDKHWREIMDGFDHDQYDGIIIKSAAHNYILGAKEYPTNAEMLAIVFEQTKIKSAIGNRGTFDPNDPNILFSRQQPDKGVSNFPNPAKYYARHAQRVIDWLYPKIGKYLGPLKDLPNQKAFQERYYLLLGGIARIEDISRRIYDTFRNASEADQRSVFNFLTNRTVPASSILNPEIRQHAVATKRLINRVGDGLVARGLLDPSTRGKYRDQYLPRIYLKHMLGESAFRNMGTGLKPGDMGYLKGRKDLSADVRALLGEITDPAYLASRGVSIPMRDMAILDFFKGIASTPRNQWVWGHHLVDGWNGPVSVFWLEAEAKRLRNQANFMQGKARQDALNLAQQYESWSAPVIAEQSDVPGNFRQIPNTGRYGALRGLWVRKEIHNLLIGSRMISDDASVAEKILGYGGWGTKVTQFWKTMKVPFNPPSQVRNLVSNFVLLHVSGVPLHRIPQRFVQAIQEIRTNGKHWRIAKKYGIKATTFTNQELLKLETELLESMRQQKPSTVADLKFWSSRIMDVVGGAYQGLESIGKTMKIIDAMEREGMSEADAVLAAQEALFDYSMVPKSIRYLRQAPIGAPFITFYYKALPMLLKNFITAPHRFLPYVLIPYLLAAMIADDYDVDVEDLEKLKKALPEWLQKRGHTMILPWKDSNGRWQVFDYGYFMPWGYFSELFNEIKQTVGSGQVGETGRIVGATGLLGGPIPDLIAAIKTNKDPFTKRDIVNKNDPPARQLSDLMTYLWRMGAPTWLTDIGYAGHTYRWLTGKVNPRLGPEYGEQLLTGPQTQARAVGVNIYPIDPKKSRMQNIRNMVSDMGNVMQRMTTKMMDPNLSPEQRRGVREEYMKEIKMRRDNIRKYQKESEVHPNLLREPK